MKDLKIAISLFVCSAGISFTNHFWKWAGKMLLFFMFKVSWGRTPWKASDYDYMITVSITAVVSLIKNKKMLSLPLGSRSLCCLSVACFEFIREESSAINYSPAWQLHWHSSSLAVFANFSLRKITAIWAVSYNTNPLRTMSLSWASCTFFNVQI